MGSVPMHEDGLDQEGLDRAEALVPQPTPRAGTDFPRSSGPPVRTSFQRDGDRGRHGSEEGVDYDAVRLGQQLDDTRGVAWAVLVQVRLGSDYDVICHESPRGGPHLHIEYEGRRQPPLPPGFCWRVNQSRDL